MAPKLFLALVGIMYLGLSVWCTFAPAVTSEKVGLDLRGGSGKSEFLVIYGGLELAMALIFLLPLVKDSMLGSSLIACLLIHGCLVLYRTISFFLYQNIQTTTYRLAIGEWAIFLLAAVLCWFHFRAGSQ